LPRILIIEDEPDLALGLRNNLEYEGCEVITANDGEEGARLACQERPDLILLDIMLPRLNGLDVCRQLRGKGMDTPIIMLTARGQEIDKVIGLEIGADDYVTKPFSIRELLARVHVQLRRQSKRETESGAYRFGEVELNFARHQAFKKGKPLDLSAREFEILKYFIELMLATGIRRGELLKIKLHHLPQGPKTTLTIEHSPDDASDPWRNEPHVKTREREIPLPKSLAISLWDYVRQYRRRGNHSYLFTSHRAGAPLDAAGVNWIFDLLIKRCFPHLKGKLHPHVLRHTFNQRLMEEAQTLGWSDDQRRKVQTYLNGWSEGSRMPEVYTRRLIEIQAMELAARYQAALYETEENHAQLR
jgi:DNA-binding response OmpR family regulator